MAAARQDAQAARILRSPPVLIAAFAGSLMLISVLLLGAAEFAARRYFPPAIGSVMEVDPYKRLILEKAPRGIVAPTVLTTNRWGMRGDDPPRDWSRWTTVIAVGSSTTLCYHLDDHKTWPYLLQISLLPDFPRTWVGNAGQDGVTSLATGVFLDAVIRRLHPGTVLFMAGASDMSLAFSDDRRERGSPYDRALMNRIDRQLAKTSLKERSRLFREYNLWKRRRARDDMVLSEAQHRSRFPDPLESPEDSVSLDSLAREPLEAFRSNILRIGSLSRAMGIRALFMTQPYLYGTDSLWARREARILQYRDADYRISAATERRLLDRFNDGLLELCASQGLECFDLAPLVPTGSAYFYDESHFTEAGAALVAVKIADYLREHPDAPRNRNPAP